MEPTTPPATTPADRPEDEELDELPEPAADELVDEAEDADELAVSDAVLEPEEVEVPVAVADESDAVVTPTVSLLVPVDVFDVVAVDVTELVAGAVSWSESTAQLPALLHEYPNGQHSSPHVDNVPVNAVVMTTLSGC